MLLLNSICGVANTIGQVGQCSFELHFLFFTEKGGLLISVNSIELMVQP